MYIYLRIKDTIVDTSFLNISNGSLLHNVPHDEPLNGLVLIKLNYHKDQIKVQRCGGRRSFVPWDNICHSWSIWLGWRGLCCACSFHRSYAWKSAAQQQLNIINSKSNQTKSYRTRQWVPSCFSIDDCLVSAARVTLSLSISSSNFRCRFFFIDTSRALTNSGLGLFFN